LNLIDLAISGNESIHFHGGDAKMKQSCHKVVDPVTFSSPESFIPITKWKDYPRFYHFSLEFQTTESFGVLAYILGKYDNHSSDHQNDQQYLIKKNNEQLSSLIALNRDFFSIEIHNRFLNVYFNLGSNYIRHEIVHEHVSNGKSHQISIEINEKFALFRFDQRPESTIRIDTNIIDKFDLNGPLIIGGIHPDHMLPYSSKLNSLDNPKIPPYFFSGVLGHGYVGCIQDVEINNQIVNLTNFIQLANVTGVNTDMCRPMPNQCEIGHCMNDGICNEGWNRFVCDCSSTGYNGPICNQRKLFLLLLFLF
jgi:neurexin